MHFSQFMDGLVLERDLTKEVSGTTATVEMVLPAGTCCTVTYPELDYDIRARVFAGRFPLPIDRNGRDRFMMKMLQYNRNAISVLDSGFVTAPDDARLCTFMWYVSKKEQPYSNWVSNLVSFENLVTTGANDLKKMISEWANWANSGH